ncbi:hypothetical protein NDU88_002583 [Pleurodeles waltl]|uniref:Uncharacterized protein n=1 Tax=Pleurodeles waltl TaxID=8319 RepID=A0AAV7RFZ8_PLEWA|nr:hypothetical protein NDU88_002583 [Pleurodeles waltl]
MAQKRENLNPQWNQPVADPAPPPEAAALVEPTHPREHPRRESDAPPTEAQGELEQTPATGTKEGEETVATDRTPTQVPVKAKGKKKGKHPKKKVDSSRDEEEKIEEAWK